MRYLVDANVLSEATRRRPDPAVVGWLEAHEGDIAIDTIVLGELAVGVVALPRGRKRSRLEVWFEALVDTVAILPWDVESCRAWADLVVDLRRRGRIMPLFDSMIAATARSRGLAVVTRNVRDFSSAGVDIVNPFQDGERPDAVHETEPRYGG
jgi:hypothetical protein